jgi:hypothetical protein
VQRLPAAPEYRLRSVRPLAPACSRYNCKVDEGVRATTTVPSSWLGVDHRQCSAGKQPNHIHRHESDPNSLVTSPASREPLVGMAAMRYVNRLVPEHSAHQGYSCINEEGPPRINHVHNSVGFSWAAIPIPAMTYPI